jgi:hypothetical protein
MVAYENKKKYWKYLQILILIAYPQRKKTVQLKRWPKSIKTV